MKKKTHPSNDSHLTQIEADDRVVVLSRTLQLSDIAKETVLKDDAINFARYGETCVGQALYRHRDVFQNAVDAPIWSHVELSYFWNVVPESAIRARVFDQQSAGADLLRAEILLTTPSSFSVPHYWDGSANRPHYQTSLEYLQVQPRYLSDYRDVMREYCGPAAAKLVRNKKFGTFRAMETAAVLYQDPRFEIEWNQIHLCELNPRGFEGFGKEFEAALRENLPEDAEFSDAFADLPGMRTIPRWTFNDVVVEMDTALAKPRRSEQTS